MYHIMFDIDGTLVESNEIDSLCFKRAVEEVTGITIQPDWSLYQHVTDSGILNEFLEKNQVKDRESTKAKVKEEFVSKLQEALLLEPLKEIPGASAFLNELESKRNVTISFATGGWLESALLKLKSAEISVGNIPIASANDHYERTKIMQIAQSRSVNQKNTDCTYFGDGVWDKEACKDLNFNFIAVGSNVEHHNSIENFFNVPEILKLLKIR